MHDQVLSWTGRRLAGIKNSAHGQPIENRAEKRMVRLICQGCVTLGRGIIGI
jgi:hypothetical protein